jgi:hypothetical protein
VLLTHLINAADSIPNGVDDSVGIEMPAAKLAARPACSCRGRRQLTMPSAHPLLGGGFRELFLDVLGKAVLGVER